MKSKVTGLYAIADSGWNPCEDLAKLTQKFLEGGCRLVQLRMNSSDQDDVSSVAKEVATLKQKWDFLFIVNDHPNIASAVGADGVHVGENDISIQEIKKAYGDKLIVGYSSHSIDEAAHAQALGADYVAFGAIFPTKTKGPGHPVQGLEKLKQLTKKLTVPVVAIGGIGRSNIGQVIDAGANSVAMISALAKAQDIVKETRWFVEKFPT